VMEVQDGLAAERTWLLILAPPNTIVDVEVPDTTRRLIQFGFDHMAVCLTQLCTHTFLICPHEIV
jgi:hypothetical protein